MAERPRKPVTPARIPPESFKFGRYAIVGQPNSNNWYRQWREEGVSSTKRLSLGTDDFEEAKIRLVEIVHRDFHDPDALRGDPLVTSVLREYRADPEVRHGSMSRVNLMLAYAEEHWPGITVRNLSPRMRKNFAKSVIERGCGVAHAANMLGALSRAVEWSGEVRDDNRILCVDPPEMPGSIGWVCKAVNRKRPPPENYHPEPHEMVKLLRVIGRTGQASAWALLSLFTGGRVTAVRLLGQHSIKTRFGQNVIDLHPPDWERSTKRNACLPLPDTILNELRKAPDEIFTPYCDGWLRELVTKAAKECKLPRVKLSSFRDYVATAIRHAHLDLDVEEVSEDDAERWMAHRDVPIAEHSHGSRIHSRYGIYRPDYLSRPKLAAEAVVLDLDRRSGGALFRHTNPHRARQNSAKRHVGGGIEGIVAEGKRASSRLDREVRSAHRAGGSSRDLFGFGGVEEGKTVEIGGIRGSFRQLSANRSTHLDAAFEPADTDFLRGSNVQLLRFIPYNGNINSDEIVIARK